MDNISRRAAVVGAAATALGALAAAAQPSVPGRPLPRRAYTFSEKAPPVLADGLDILAVWPEDLEIEIGQASWTVVQNGEDAMGSFPGMTEFKGTFERSQFRAVRKYRWTNIPPTNLYSEDIDEEVVNYKGYTRTERERFEREVGIALKAGGPELSAEVTQKLKFEKETTQVWQEHEQRTTKRRFHKNVRYARWILHDVLTVSRNQLKWKQVTKNPPDSSGNVPTLTQATIAVALFVYEDRFPAA